MQHYFVYESFAVSLIKLKGKGKLMSGIELFTVVRVIGNNVVMVTGGRKNRNTSSWAKGLALAPKQAERSLRTISGLRSSSGSRIGSSGVKLTICWKNLIHW